jgi:hypothetical protein
VTAARGEEMTMHLIRAAARSAILVATMLLALNITVAPSNAVAAGCYDESCNGKYYKTMGCWDAAPKSNTVSWWPQGSSTRATVQLYYSRACGAAFAYVKNLSERSGWICDAWLFRSRDNLATWDLAYWEPVETPSYNFAYTLMVGDAGATEKGVAQATCDRYDGSRLVRETSPAVREW